MRKGKENDRSETASSPSFVDEVLLFVDKVPCERELGGAAPPVLDETKDPNEAEGRME